jgi:hypothetical protein
MSCGRIENSYSIDLLNVSDLVLISEKSIMQQPLIIMSGESIL